MVSSAFDPNFLQVTLFFARDHPACGLALFSVHAMIAAFRFDYTIVKDYVREHLL